jgi:hypothetical protein
MRSNHVLIACGSFAALLAATNLWSWSGGIFPGFPLAPDAARRTPSCGMCHGASQQGLNGLHVTVTPTARSLALGETISVTTQATGGAVSMMGVWGGLVSENTDGTFVAGTNTQVDGSGAFVTHFDPSLSNNRTFTYGYVAPMRPGPVDVYSVCNTVDGDFTNSGDIWGFSGSDAALPEGTPARLFVNADGVQRIGDGCRGSFENWPVLGSRESPTIGNANFSLEVVGAAAGQPAALLIGIRRAVPIDLSIIGITGCLLHINSSTSRSTTTSAGSTQRGEGVARFALAIPNLPSLIGGTLDFQSAIIDPPNGRGIPITLTNAVGVTFR